MLSDYLTDWGMAVSTAADADAALAELRGAAVDGRPFAVVLLDRFMPGMDGLELRNVIVAEPGLAAGVVLMTGLGQERDLGDVAEFVVCSTLSKPIRRDDLRSCLRQVLGLEVATSSPSHRVSPPPRIPKGPAWAGCSWPRTI